MTLACMTRGCEAKAISSFFGTTPKLVMFEVGKVLTVADGGLLSRVEDDWQPDSWDIRRRKSGGGFCGEVGWTPSIDNQ